MRTSSYLFQQLQLENEMITKVFNAGSSMTAVHAIGGELDIQ